MTLRAHDHGPVDEASAIRRLQRDVLVHAQGSRALARALLDQRAARFLQQAHERVSSPTVDVDQDGFRGRELAIAGVSLALRTLRAADGLCGEGER